MYRYKFAANVIHYQSTQNFKYQSSSESDNDSHRYIFNVFLLIFELA